MNERSDSVRTVNLRILRDGPTHNHLMSPLTPYLAAVGPYEAVTVRMPYEHRRLLRDLNALRYGANKTRAASTSYTPPTDRKIIADEVGGIFAAIPGLTAEMATEARCDAQLTHLSLVFSAAELSLLPFEIGSAPRGFPGEGLPLSVQSVAPVVMTRALPGATGQKCNWVKDPKILFVIAEPAGLAPVPHRAHLLALMQALAPWTGPIAEFSSPTAEAALSRHLRVLPRATVSDIEQACDGERFTHIHILAHSEVVEEGGQSQFALALHHRQSGKELVSAERLQSILRLPIARRSQDHELSHPLVVSLATCDSSNVGQVVFPSMSLAHALHAAGVPLVVGSLFPLSFRGSTIVTQVLYRGLLKGRDPRWTLYDVRHALYRAEQDTHDWASLVAYAALPTDVEAQFRALAFRASSRGISASIRGGSLIIPPSVKGGRALLKERVDKIDAAVAKLATELPINGPFLLEGQGVLASSEKRRAELYWLAAQELLRAAPGGEVVTTADPEFIAESKLRLRRARDRYWQAAHAPRWQVSESAHLPDFHWVLSQALSLDFVLDLKAKEPTPFKKESWLVARVDAENYLAAPANWTEEKGGSPAMWARASLAELYLIAHGARVEAQVLETSGLERPGGEPGFRNKAIEHMAQHVELARREGERTEEYLDSTRTQFNRYSQWWFDSRFCGADVAEDPRATDVVALSREMLALLA